MNEYDEKVCLAFLEGIKEVHNPSSDIEKINAIKKSSFSLSRQDKAYLAGIDVALCEIAEEKELVDEVMEDEDARI